MQKNESEKGDQTKVCLCVVSIWIAGNTMQRFSIWCAHIFVTCLRKRSYKEFIPQFHMLGKYKKLKKMKRKRPDIQTHIHSSNTDSSKAHRSNKKYINKRIARTIFNRMLRCDAAPKLICGLFKLNTHTHTCLKLNKVRQMVNHLIRILKANCVTIGRCWNNNEK